MSVSIIIRPFVPRGHKTDSNQLSPCKVNAECAVCKPSGRVLVMISALRTHCAQYIKLRVNNSTDINECGLDDLVTNTPAILRLRKCS